MQACGQLSTGQPSNVVLQTSFIVCVFCCLEHCCLWHFTSCCCKYCSSRIATIFLGILALDTAACAPSHAFARTTHRWCCFCIICCSFACLATSLGYQHCGQTRWYTRWFLVYAIVFVCGAVLASNRICILCVRACQQFQWTARISCLRRLDNFSFILSGSLLFLNTFILTMLSTALVWAGIDGAFTGKRNEMYCLILGALYSLLLLVVMSFTLLLGAI